MSLQIDDVDKRILYRLAAEARHTSAPDIAAEVGLSAPTIRNRIRRLEDAGVIQGYHADIDYERVGGRLTNLFVCTTQGTDRARIARRIAEITNVISVREVMTGHGDIQVTAIGTNTDSIARTARDIKTLGADIEDEDLVHREHHSPYGPFGPDEEQGHSPVSGLADLPGDADIVEVEIGDKAPLAGTMIRDAVAEGLLDADLLIITIERGDETLTPHGDSELTSGDRVTLLTRAGLTADVLANFAGNTASTN